MQQEKTTVKGKESKTHNTYIYIYIYIYTNVKGAIVQKLPTKAQKHTRHHHKKRK